MRLFFPIEAFYPSQIGGPCNSVYWLTKELSVNNIENQIFTTTTDIPQNLVQENVYLQKDFGKVYYDSEHNIFKKMKQIANGIKNNDIIHLTGLFGFHGMISYFTARIFFPKKPVIVSARGELNKKALIYNPHLKKIVLFLYKLFSKNVLFHSTSPEENQDIKNIFGNVNIVELPNYFIPEQRINVQHKNKELLYLGRIHHKKAIHKILEGLFLSKYFKNSPFKFIIVGKHEERHQEYYDFLNKLITQYQLKDKVEFLGFKTGKEKEKIYAQSFMMMMLSETENFGNVVIEALNQGTPVIASKGTPWEILPEAHCGYHISNEPKVIAETIDQVLSLSDEDYNTLKNNAYKLVDEKFLIKTQIINWIKVYQSLIK